jgi:DNA-directed RNA polymerase specialized sigma24 family protein
MVCAKSQSVFTVRLPELQRITKSAFRHLDGDRQEEAVQNTIALAWKQYRALVIKGRTDAEQMLTSILYYSIQQTKCGRTIQSCPVSSDTLEKRRRGETTVEDIDVHDLMGRTTPVLEAVSFRVDVPRFFDTLTDRQRETARLLASGFTTSEVAESMDVTPGAVSQFRTRFKMLYEDFFAVA